MPVSAFTRLADTILALAILFIIGLVIYMRKTGKTFKDVVQEIKEI